MATYHEFDEAAIAAALAAAGTEYGPNALLEQQTGGTLAEDGRLSITASCVSVKVNDGKICLKLPFRIGNVCLPIPKSIPNGTVAEACLTICTKWGIPTGVTVTVAVAGKTLLKKSFGIC